MNFASPAGAWSCGKRALGFQVVQFSRLLTWQQVGKVKQAAPSQAARTKGNRLEAACPAAPAPEQLRDCSANPAGPTARVDSASPTGSFPHSRQWHTSRTIWFSLFHRQINGFTVHLHKAVPWSSSPFLPLPFGALLMKAKGQKWAASLPRTLRLRSLSA